MHQQIPFQWLKNIEGREEHSFLSILPKQELGKEEFATVEYLLNILMPLNTVVKRKTV